MLRLARLPALRSTARLSTGRLACQAIHSSRVGSDQRANSSQKNAKSKGKTVLKRLIDLPTQARDAAGQALPPLPPFSSTASPIKSAPPSSAIDPNAIDTSDIAWDAAVQSGAYPRTPLAREVWTHTVTYPGCLILTRVGMFYETYFGQAPLVAALLQIQLTSKKFAVKADDQPVVESEDTHQPKAKAKSKSKASSPRESKKVLFPFAGFPISQRDKYFKELLALGHSVVVVEERDAYNVETDRNRVVAQGAAGQKERFVSRRLTPGTLMLENWASEEDSRYLLSIALEVQGGGGGEAATATADDARPVGLAWIDISTDRAVVTKTSTIAELEHEIARLAPVEVIVDPRIKAAAEKGDDSACKSILDQVTGGEVFLTTRAAPSGEDTAKLPRLESLAAGAIHEHLKECLREHMPTLLPPNHQSAAATMKIDASTLLSLEIRQTIRQGQTAFRGPHSSAVSRAGTLLSVIKRTLTPSGTRLLVNTLCAPSARVDVISSRHDLVEAFYVRATLREDLRDKLREMTLRNGDTGAGSTRGDLGRIVQRFLAWKDSAAGGFGSGLPFGRALWDLKTAIEGMSWMRSRVGEELKLWTFASAARSRLQEWHDSMRVLDELADFIGASVSESALTSAIEAANAADEAADGTSEEPAETPKPAIPLSRSEQEAADRAAMWWIKPTFSPGLQALHELNDNLQDQKRALLANLQKTFAAPSLDIRSSKQGFLVYAKAEHSRALEASSEMILVSSARSARYFVHAPWTKLGHEIQDAGDRLLAAQQDAFRKLRQSVIACEAELLNNAGLMSELDLAMGFAQVAEELRFVRPSMNDGLSLSIVNGRHPTVETGLRKSFAPRNFVPNSLHISPSGFLHVITGPNMGGKSTVLRQTAIITILAQAGSFVPAESAEIGVVDAVFSRIGARDDLFMDRSTFMVEMHETAYILRRATERSLVIMDEIGRGTTLQSGLSIAYATLDHIYRNIRCRTLFATHIHELADKVCQPGIKHPLPGVEFWCTDLEEIGSRFSYSYKLHPGVNKQSHAIKVARQAGMPSSFLEVATETLQQLEAQPVG